MKFLCWIGLHDWKYDKEEVNGLFWRICQRCALRQATNERCSCGCDGMRWENK